MLQRLIGEDIRAETQTAEGLPPVMLDRGQLEQVIMNLAANARDAMPRGGRLTVATSSASAKEFGKLSGKKASKKSYVKLVVSDTGIGMDERTRQHIFEPFTTKEAGKGTGFGLATVYGIVAQSGGHISVSSELGWDPRSPWYSLGRCAH